MFWIVRGTIQNCKGAINSQTHGEKKCTDNSGTSVSAGRSPFVATVIAAVVTANAPKLRGEMFYLSLSPLEKIHPPREEGRNE
jgi:hypothetical protein